MFWEIRHIGPVTSFVCPLTVPNGRGGGVSDLKVCCRPPPHPRETDSFRNAADRTQPRRYCRPAHNTWGQVPGPVPGCQLPTPRWGRTPGQVTAWGGGQPLGQGQRYRQPPRAAAVARALFCLRPCVPASLPVPRTSPGTRPIFGRVVSEGGKGRQTGVHFPTFMVHDPRPMSRAGRESRKPHCWWGGSQPLLPVFPIFFLLSGAGGVSPYTLPWWSASPTGCSRTALPPYRSANLPA